MRTLWSIRIRPILRSRDHLTSNNVPVLSRRSTSLHWPARLQFKDAFLIFLVPVLTTALVVDVSWKSKRRKEWEDKIAAVQAEIQALHTQRTERWLAYQYRTLRAGTLIQRRSYSTAAATLPEDVGDEDEDWPELQTWPPEESLIGEQPQNVEHNPNMLESSQYRELPHDWRRLVALRFALQLQIASRQIVQRDNRGSWALFPQHHVDLDTLVEHLKKVHSQYLYLCKSRPKNEPIIFERTATYGSRKLDAQLRDLSAELTSGRISLPDFIQNLSTNIIQSDSSPGIRGYYLMLRLLQKAGFHKGQQSLCYLVYRAIINSHLSLDDRTVFEMLKLLGRNKDLRRIDRLLHSLTKCHYSCGGFPSWHWQTADGVQLPVPKTGNSFLYCSLIDIALRCDQPQRAHAWRLLVPIEMNHHLVRAKIVGSFLHYHTARGQWTEGKRWLRDALELALDLGRNSLPSLRALVLDMLGFCVACRKSSLYQKILDSAVKANVGVYQINLAKDSFFTTRHSDILIEWTALNDQHRTTGTEYYPQDPGSVFHELVTARMGDLDESSDVQARLSETDFGPSMSSHRKYAERHPLIIADHFADSNSIPPRPSVRTNRSTESRSTQPIFKEGSRRTVDSGCRRLNLDVEPQMSTTMVDSSSRLPPSSTYDVDISLRQTESDPVDALVPSIRRTFSYSPQLSSQQAQIAPTNKPAPSTQHALSAETLHVPKALWPTSQDPSEHLSRAQPGMLSEALEQEARLAVWQIS